MAINGTDQIDPITQQQIQIGQLMVQNGQLIIERAQMMLKIKELTSMITDKDPDGPGQESAIAKAIAKATADEPEAAAD